jgi:hypothetical protein
MRPEPPEDVCSCHKEPIKERAPPRLLGRSQADVFSRNRIPLLLFSSTLPFSNVPVYRWKCPTSLLLWGYLQTNRHLSAGTNTTFQNRCRASYSPLWRLSSLALWQVQLHAPQCAATYRFCIARLALLRHDLRIAGSHLAWRFGGRVITHLC